MAYIASIIGLIISNFVYQLMSDIPNYQIAFERSYFQLVAIGTVFLLSFINK